MKKMVNLKTEIYLWIFFLTVVSFAQCWSIIVRNFTPLSLELFYPILSCIWFSCKNNWWWFFHFLLKCTDLLLYSQINFYWWCTLLHLISLMRGPTFSSEYTFISICWVELLGTLLQSIHWVKLIELLSTLLQWFVSVWKSSVNAKI